MGFSQNIIVLITSQNVFYNLNSIFVVLTSRYNLYLHVDVVYFGTSDQFHTRDV